MFVLEVSHYCPIILDSNQTLLRVAVINGTLWLHLGGNVHDFQLVIGKPPQTSSGISLEQALGELVQVITLLTLKFSSFTEAFSNVSLVGFSALRVSTSQRIFF